MRSFFSGKQKKEVPKVKKEEKVNAEAKNEKEEKSEDAAVEDKGETKEDKEAETGSASQSDDSEPELTNEDIKSIQKLIREQDLKIEKHEAKLEAYEVEVKKMKQKVQYQMAENDNTVKRYRK